MERTITFLLFYCVGLSCLAQAPDAELISQETSISLKNEKLIKSINYEIQINNRDGEKFATISIPFSRLIKVAKIEASIKDTNGVIIRKLLKSELKEKSAISDYSLFEDNYVKEFTLKHNVYPYRICYSYEEQEEEYLSIENWLPVLDLKIPTRKAVLKAELPVGYKVSYRSQFTDSFRSDTTSLSVITTWVASYTNLIEPETSSPGLINLMPRVIIVPDEFKYDLTGSLGSWSKYGEWETNLLKGLSDLPPGEKYIIQNLISGVNDTKEKVKKLYYYLQDHTRYVNITIETGGLKPYPASYVAENKYGDCKALTNYFKSVLEIAGIRSFYTDVNAGDKIAEIYKSFPSQQFNHVILCVPVNNDSIWLDCTSKMAFRYLGTFTSARDVFLVDEGRSHLTRTPELSYNDVKESRLVFLHQDSQNQTVADFRNTYRGEKYEYYFDLSSSVNEADRLQIFRNNIVRNGFELIDFNISAPPRDSAEILLTYSARSGKIYKAYGNDLIIDVLPFSVPQFEDPKKRKLPVQIDFPVYKTDSLVYDIPPDYKVPGKLTNQSITSEFGKYGVKYVTKDNQVSIVKSFLLFPGKYSLDRYSDFYKFITRVNQIENNDFIVTSKKF
jgi:hypothetical protein